MKSPALLLVLTLGFGAQAAEPLTPEQLARVRHDEAAALARVEAAHGHRKPSEMEPEERRQVIEEQSAAIDEALRRNGVDAKSYARQSARLDREQYAEVEAQLRRLQAEEARARKPGTTAPRAGEIEVEYGTPVSLEPAQQASGDVEVEYGTPVELTPGELPSPE